MNNSQCRTYSYQGENYYTFYPYEITLDKGKYLIELWGARGAKHGSYPVAYGAYVSGIIEFKKKITLYLHTGSAGIYTSPKRAYGGGGPGQFGGGGATDIRLVSGPYVNFEGLKSRIMVASGSGALDSGDTPGAGGGLVGFNSASNNGWGGNQTLGGQSGSPGKFGFGGGDPSNTGGDGNGAGGSGYFGGGSSRVYNDYAGGGGSSFISGHPGCIAIDRDFTEENMLFSTASDRSIHFSNYRFTNTTMIDGNSPCPHPSYINTTYEYSDKFHPNNGFARIPFLSAEIANMISCPKFYAPRLGNVYVYVYQLISEFY